MTDFHQWSDVEPKMIGMWEDALLTVTSIDKKCFNGKHQACPSCGGSDRFRFDNNRYEKGDGGAICSQCGSGNGMYWIRKLTGMDFPTAINSLGDFLRLIPRERIEIAKKNVELIPDNNYSITMSQDAVNGIMRRCVEYPTHVYPLAEGIAPEPLYVMEKRVTDGVDKKTGEVAQRVVDSRICVPMVNIIEFPAKGKEPVSQLCNVTMIDKDGNMSWPDGRDDLHPSGKMSFGAVSVIGRNTGAAIYLCADWSDAWRVHFATSRTEQVGDEIKYIAGAQVWCCYTVANLDKVAHKFKEACRSGVLRMACNYNKDELIMAEQNECKVIIPDGSNVIHKARKFKKVIYDAKTLLDEM